jgi:ring-1,2-phenylacetyl-CoA epoxidase subunit PaaC
MDVPVNDEANKGPALYSAVVTPTEEARAEAARRGVDLITPDPAFDVLPTIDLPLPGAAPGMPSWLAEMDSGADEDAEQALNALLLATADDEFILGYRNSEWTGIGPMLEEDVAFSSISQDEIGHARLFYMLLADRIGLTADRVAYARPPEGFRNALLQEQPRASWAFTLVRQYLYDQYDHLLLDALANSRHEPLAQATAKIMREEKYHIMHGELWMRRLAEGKDEVRARLDAALRMAWPLALGLFEERPGEDLLLEAGYLPATSADVREEWLKRVGGQLTDLGVALPDGDEPPAAGGRRGRHGYDFAMLYEEMTSVYRIDPDAEW